MLVLPMGGKGPRHKFHVALGIADPLADPLLLDVSLPCNPDYAVLYRVSPKCVARLTIYYHHLGHICV